MMTEPRRSYRAGCSITSVVLFSVMIGGVCRSSPAWEVGDFDFHHENVMGTSLELWVRADQDVEARRAEGRVLAEIDRLSALLSTYDPASEFSRWQAASVGPVETSSELFEVLRTSDVWRDRTGGAFDPRVQVLTEIWARASRIDRTPSREELSAAVAGMRSAAWRLDGGARTVERLGGHPLNLNAIAKGYIVERACAAALDPSRGVHGASLNVGGDLRVCGDYTRTVGIVAPSADSESSEPLTWIEVRNRAVAASGRSQRGFQIGGRWYSHIIDPRSGAPADRIAGATVIAERSADADALATAFNILDPAESLRLVESLDGVDCLIVTSAGRVVRSPGWSKYELRESVPFPVASARKFAAAGPADAEKPGAESDARPWGDAFELVVDFEINRPDELASRYRRPYVAVWVEDENGFPVRNLILWLSQGGAGPFQWVPDLKRWYAADRVRKKVDKKDLILTFSRPTRPPGKYSAVWNGKDDKGRPLPAGKYTISIDAAREHGTYQGLRATVAIGDEPFTEALEGGIEIKSARISYRRKNEAKE